MRSIDRLPLPGRNSPGFLVNRVRMSYLPEAVDLLDEGIPAPAIDRATLDFGMPLGPLAMADSVGLDICLAVARRLGTGLAAPEEPPPQLTRLVTERRLGRKSGQGVYRYRKDRGVPAHLPLAKGSQRCRFTGRCCESKRDSQGRVSGPEVAA